MKKLSGLVLLSAMSFIPAAFSAPTGTLSADESPNDFYQNH
ncbi:hypothetical protein [Klebsiella oxytoca]|nr:hypothetical protein [Klebsiella oxytoca]MDM4307914.1 hypothetical protein [Klebsiella oxytoca]